MKVLSPPLLNKSGRQCHFSCLNPFLQSFYKLTDLLFNRWVYNVAAALLRNLLLSEDKLAHAHSGKAGFKAGKVERLCEVGESKEFSQALNSKKPFPFHLHCSISYYNSIGPIKVFTIVLYSLMAPESRHRKVSLWLYDRAKFHSVTVKRGEMQDETTDCYVPFIITTKTLTQTRLWWNNSGEHNRTRSVILFRK